MNIYFLWKFDDATTLFTNEDTCEIIEGNDWWIENNQSFDIVNVKKIDEVFTYMIAKPMPENYMGGNDIHLKNSIERYKVVKQNKLYKWDIIGNWNRLRIEIPFIPTHENIQKLLTDIKTWVS